MKIENERKNLSFRMEIYDVVKNRKVYFYEQITISIKNDRFEVLYINCIGILLLNRSQGDIEQIRFVHINVFLSLL